MNTLTTPRVQSDENRLVARAAAGDRDAQRELYVQFREAVFAVAYRITGRREDALDVVQDAFIRAFEGLSGFQHESGFKTWLMRIAANKSLDLLRSRKVRRAAPIGADDDTAVEPGESDDRRVQAAGSAGPSAGLEASELADRLQAAIATLPPDQQSVFVLYAGGEMTYGQIAETLGVPVGTVMSRLFHARRRLHVLLPDLRPQSAREDEP